MASSRVGASTSASGAGTPWDSFVVLAGNVLRASRACLSPRRYTVGSRNAKVLPEPVLATATTSRPSHAGGQARFWISDGEVKPAFASADLMREGKHVASNESQVTRRLAEAPSRASRTPFAAADIAAAFLFERASSSRSPSPFSSRDRFLSFLSFLSFFSFFSFLAFFEDSSPIAEAERRRDERGRCADRSPRRRVPNAFSSS